MNNTRVRLVDMSFRQTERWKLDGVSGPIVVIDVIRAFTTAAYAFGAGAAAIYLVAGVDEALRFKDQNMGVLAMGEDHGRRPAGFDFPNSPVAVSRSDLTGRTLVQRSSAGTQALWLRRTQIGFGRQVSFVHPQPLMLSSRPTLVTRPT